MSWVGVMIGVGVGAASGGIMTGLNGGDVGDILQSMAIGGAMGAAGGAAGGALAGGAGGAAGGAGGAAAGTSGGALGGAGGAAAGAGTGTLGAAGTAAAESMLAPTAMGLSSVGGGALGGGAAGTGGGALGGALGGGALGGGTGGALGAAGTATAESLLSPTAMGLSSVGGGAGGATTGVASSAPSWGTSIVSKAFDSPVTGNIAQIGGKALEQGVYGAGIGALGSGLTGQDIGKGAGLGFVGGAVGGAGQSALASQAGTATGALGAAAKFAAESPTITSGLISVPTSMALNSMTAPDAAGLPTTPENPWSKKFKYNQQFNYNSPFTYAAGGITDLDSYASQAQNISTGGITQIPNSTEVADPEGYGQDSMRMMAQGGIADLGGYAAGGRPNLLHGAGDGVSDDIPATIAGKQPARLAAGEYVIPSRIVSELGNGSTDAGAQRLDEMVQKIQAGRKKTIGSKKQFANDSKAYKHLTI